MSIIKTERVSSLLAVLFFCSAGGLLGCGSASDASSDAGAGASGGGRAGGGGGTSATGGGGGTGVKGGGGGTSTTGGGGGSRPDAGSTTNTGGGTGGQSDGGQQDAKCKNALVCDDFEQYTTGAAPGSPWTVMLSNAQASSITVDATRARSGSRAVKVSVAAAPADKTYRSAMLAFQGTKLPVTGNALFGRMMFWLESAPEKDVHWTFIDGYGMVPGKDYHAFYRYGGQHPITNNGSFVGNQLMANYETPDTYQTPPVGISSDCYLHADKKVVPSGKWACAEWNFDGSKNQMRFWLDGVELTDLAMNGTGQGCGAQSQDFVWTAPTFTRIDVGWESYQADDARTMWIDDVAIGTERLGCP